MTDLGEVIVARVQRQQPAFEAEHGVLRVAQVLHLGGEVAVDVLGVAERLVRATVEGEREVLGWEVW